jgi:hypothetical protein
LKDDYLDVRRTHFFVTHRVAGEIPEAQISQPAIIINEIMYHPAGVNDDEFIELYNPSPTESIDMSGWNLNGVGLYFPPGTVLLPQSYLVVVENDVQFRTTYGSGIFVAAQYDGSLDNGGENLVLRDRDGNVIDEVRYDDGEPWYPSTDGGGPSLELIDASQNNNHAMNWAASASAGGTPGTSNSMAGTTPFVPDLWVNEVLLFNGSINTDEQGEYDSWVEIYNASPNSIDMGGMYLTDDYNNPAKWQIPADTVINSGQWILFWADAEPNDGPLHTNFSLNSEGGFVGLYTSGSGNIDYLNYDPIPTDVSYGRYPDGTKSRREFTTPTPGAENYLEPVPVILNEYNAVSGSKYLKDSGTDTFWGRIAGNGGDWFELVVTQDHLDMRNWRLRISDDTGGAGQSVQTLFLTGNQIWSDVRSGTIITVSEDLPDDLSNYDPENGKWWINVQANDDASGTYITAADFKVSNDNWQLTIRDSNGTDVFGPAGEGIKPDSGIGSDEVFSLQEDPDFLINERSNYEDSTSSTFGSANIYADGEVEQDFSELRFIPDSGAPEPNPLVWKITPTSTEPASITMIAATASDPLGVEYYFNNVTDPNHDSGWQSYSYYKDKNLQAGTLYTYRVKARDKSPSQNETEWSSGASTATSIILFEDDFETDLGNWTTDGGTCTWIRDQGGTPSSNTGPNHDNTIGDANGWYIYVEASSSNCQNSDLEAIVESPDLDADTYSIDLSFYYHMYGSQMGNLHVDVYNGSTWVNDVWSISGQQHTSSSAAYTEGTVDLVYYSGTIRVRFRYDGVTGYAADAALDDIIITGEPRTVNNRTLILSSTTGGSVTTPGEGAFQYDLGTDVNLVAKPDVNYHFVEWTGDISTVADPYSATTTITMDANYAVQANFAIDTHTVTFIEGANGSITGTLVQVVDHGNDCTAVTAEPDTNYHFTGWTGDYTGSDNPLTIQNVTTDMTITANFAIDTHTVTFIEGANGSITGTLVQVVDHGNDCTAVTAEPNANYHFTGWTGDYVGSDNPLTIQNVTADMTITANFVIDQKTLTCSSTVGGSVTVPGEGTFQYDYGSDVNIVAISDTNYQFVNWTGTAVTAGKVTNPNVASTTVQVDGNYIVVANFEDSTPPSPDPMTWTSVPTATGTSTITMTAMTAIDDSPPVEYYFECTNYSDANSGWQTSPTYEVQDLNPSTLYTFRVKARDSAPSHNETAFSSTASVTTHIPPTEVEILGSWVLGTTHSKVEGPNRALIFFAHAEHDGAININSVTYGGQPMTKIMEYNVGTPEAQAYVTAFILDEGGIVAATSNTFDIEWNPSSPLESTKCSVFLSNVDQAALIGATGQDGGVAPSVPNPITAGPLSTRYGDMVFGAAMCGFEGDYTPNNGFIEGYQRDMPTSVCIGMYKSATVIDETPSATYTGGYLSRQVIIGFVVRTTEPTETPKLTTSSSPGGSVTVPGEGEFIYLKGSDANIVAVPELYYHFVGWTGTAVDAGKVADPCALSTAVLMNANYTVVANFEADPPDTTPAEVNILGDWVSGVIHAKEQGPRRALIFFAHAESNDIFNINSVTYGGQQMAPIMEYNVGTDSAQAYVAAYILDENGVAAANCDTFIPVWSSTPLEYSYASVFLSNVHQIIPIGAANSDGTATGTPNPITTSPLSTGYGDMVFVAATAGIEGDYTINNGFSKGYENDMISSVGTAGYKSTTGADETPSVTHSNAKLNRQVIIGFVIQAAIPIPTGELTISSTSGGSVAVPGEGEFIYPQGSDINIVAVPDLHYYFDGWTGTAVAAGKVGNPDSATTTVTVDANYTAIAHFVIDEHFITASADANGAIDPNGLIIKYGGEDQLFTATASSGYIVDTWYLDGNDVQSSGVTYLLSNIQADHTVYVTFRLLIDDFNDNKRGAMWRLLGSGDWYSNLFLLEQEENLQVSANGQGGNSAAWYYSNGWSLDPNGDFVCEVDFHYNELTDQNGWIGIGVENQDMYVTLTAGSDSNGLYFYYEAQADSNVVIEQEIRDFNDGILYISYDADTNNIYLSHDGPGPGNAYIWSSIPNPLTCQWNSNVAVGIGCGGNYLTSTQGRAYLDNFRVVKGEILGWPPVTDIDGDGYVDLFDLSIIADNWLGPGVGIEGGDINGNGIGDGTVNLRDLAELGLAW